MHLIDYNYRRGWAWGTKLSADILFNNTLNRVGYRWIRWNYLGDI